MLWIKAKFSSFLFNNSALKHEAKSKKKVITTGIQLNNTMIIIPYLLWQQREYEDKKKSLTTISMNINEHS